MGVLDDLDAIIAWDLVRISDLAIFKFGVETGCSVADWQF